MGWLAEWLCCSKLFLFSASWCFSVQKDSKQKREFFEFKKILTGIIQFSKYNNDLDQLEGLITLKRDLQGEKINIQNIVLREQTICFTDWVIGMVIYAGLNSYIYSQRENLQFFPLKKSAFKQRYSYFFSINIIFIIINILFNVIVHMTASYYQLAQLNFGLATLPTMIYLFTCFPFFFQPVHELYMLANAIYHNHLTGSKSQSSQSVTTSKINLVKQYGDLALTTHVLLNKTDTLCNENDFVVKSILIDKQFYQIDLHKLELLNQNIELTDSQNSSEIMSQKKIVSPTTQKNPSDIRLFNQLKHESIILTLPQEEKQKIAEEEKSSSQQQQQQTSTNPKLAPAQPGTNGQTTDTLCSTKGLQIPSQRDQQQLKNADALLPDKDTKMFTFHRIEAKQSVNPESAAHVLSFNNANSERAGHSNENVPPSSSSSSQDAARNHLDYIKEDRKEVGSSDCRIPNSARGFQSIDLDQVQNRSHSRSIENVLYSRQPSDKLCLKTNENLESKVPSNADISDEERNPRLREPTTPNEIINTDISEHRRFVMGGCTLQQLQKEDPTPAFLRAHKTNDDTDDGGYQGSLFNERNFLNPFITGMPQQTQPDEPAQSIREEDTFRNEELSNASQDSSKMQQFQNRFQLQIYPLSSTQGHPEKAMPAPGNVNLPSNQDLQSQPQSSLQKSPVGQIYSFSLASDKLQSQTSQKIEEEKCAEVKNP